MIDREARRYGDVSPLSSATCSMASISSHQRMNTRSVAIWDFRLMFARSPSSRRHSRYF